MKRQKSFETDGGVLYVVGTPIGNLGDLSVRTKQILGEVDLIACEDTRHTRKLLSHLGISTAMISYHGYNRLTRLPLLLDRLQEGKSIALVSDAGTPGISDPGEELIHQVVEAEIPVIPVPGANAALCALVASGLPPQPFLFIGFLPRNSKERMTELTKWKETPATLIFYEAPHRIRPMLKDVMEVLGDRKTALARELTKKHEEWMRGNLSACLQELRRKSPGRMDRGGGGGVLRWDRGGKWPGCNLVAGFDGEGTCRLAYPSGENQKRGHSSDGGRTLSSQTGSVQ